MIYIITPVFNRKTFTKNYLNALDKQTNKNFKVLIVDDGSTDGTSEMIEKEFPDVILLKEKGDLWWAEATNIGVKYAIFQGADYIMTLNDDTVPSENYIEKMYYWIEKEPIALLGALAIDEKTNNIIEGGEKRNWLTETPFYIKDTLKPEEQIGIHEVDFFPGRGLVIPSKVFNTIGYYDSKNFPQTVADLDFTYRAKNAGFKIYCNYDAKIKIYPEESGGVKLRKKKNLRNYYNHLFGMRGGGNLKWFTLCTLKNCPKKTLIPFLIIGLMRRIFGYILK